MQIRKATAQDYPAILGLIHEFAHFQKTPERVSITLEQMHAERERFHCLVAEIDPGVIAGFATFFPAYYSWTGNAMYLDDLYVKESFRQKGIGKKLLEEVITLARENNCKKIRWQVSRWNLPAIEFYQSLGVMVDDVEINCDYHLL